MRRALLLASTLLLVGTAAIAAQVPAADASDPRVRHAVFDGGVVEVHAAELRSLSIQLCPGDTIPGQNSIMAGVLSVPDGSKGSDGKAGTHFFWEPVPIGNVMTLKPDDMVPTNMQVIADTAAGGKRLYQFDLIPHRTLTEPIDPKQPDGLQRTVAWYSIDFRCPLDEKAAALARWRARQAAEREQAARDNEEAAKDRLSTDFLGGKSRSWGYSVQTGAAK